MFITASRPERTRFPNGLGIVFDVGRLENPKRTIHRALESRIRIQILWNDTKCRNCFLIEFDLGSRLCANQRDASKKPAQIQVLGKLTACNVLAFFRIFRAWQLRNVTKAAKQVLVECTKIIKVLLVCITVREKLRVNHGRQVGTCVGMRIIHRKLNVLRQGTFRLATQERTGILRVFRQGKIKPIGTVGTHQNVRRTANQGLRKVLIVQVLVRNWNSFGIIAGRTGTVNGCEIGHVAGESCFGILKRECIRTSSGNAKVNARCTRNLSNFEVASNGGHGGPIRTKFDRVVLHKPILDFFQILGHLRRRRGLESVNVRRRIVAAILATG